MVKPLARFAARPHRQLLARHLCDGHVPPGDPHCRLGRHGYTYCSVPLHSAPEGEEPRHRSAVCKPLRWLLSTLLRRSMAVERAFIDQHDTIITLMCWGNVPPPGPNQAWRSTIGESGEDALSSVRVVSVSVAVRAPFTLHQAWLASYAQTESSFVPLAGYVFLCCDQVYGRPAGRIGEMLRR